MWVHSDPRTLVSFLYLSKHLFVNLSRYLWVSSWLTLVSVLCPRNLVFYLTTALFLNQVISEYAHLLWSRHLCMYTLTFPGRMCTALLHTDPDNISTIFVQSSLLMSLPSVTACNVFQIVEDVSVVCQGRCTKRAEELPIRPLKEGCVHGVFFRISILSQCD